MTCQNKSFISCCAQWVLKLARHIMFAENPLNILCNTLWKSLTCCSTFSIHGRNPPCTTMLLCHNERHGVSNHWQLHGCLFNHIGQHQRKQHSLGYRPFIWEIQQCPVDSPHKGPVMHIMCHQNSLDMMFHEPMSVIWISKQIKTFEENVWSMYWTKTKPMLCQFMNGHHDGSEHLLTQEAPEHLCTHSVNLTRLSLVPHICVSELPQHWFRQWLVACLFGAKPLPEPMLAYCQLDSWEQISVKFESEFCHIHSRKLIWKCCLPLSAILSRGRWVNGYHANVTFVQVSSW